MKLIEKIKKYFKKEDNKKRAKQQSVPMPESKYNNMIILAPYKAAYEGDDSRFYIYTFGENGEPITDEILTIIFPDEKYELQTDWKGMLRIPINLPVGKYVFDIVFPNGDYSQSIEGNLIVKAASSKPTSPKKPKKPKSTHSKKPSKISTNFYAPNMKMYSKKQTQYYIMLRDGNYDAMQGEEIRFIVDDEVYISKTDEKGFARLDKEFPPGKNIIKYEYLGNEKYEKSEGESTINVLVRNEDKELMIDVEHLSMEFKVTKDKIDTLKEFIIRTAKRNKEEHEKIKVLDDISFKVYKGDRVGILGFNGAGKSTLLKIMSGIYEPTSGTITTYGNIAPLLELGAGFDKNYTGKNNIFLNGAFLSMKEDFIKEKYDEIVEFSELGEFIDYPIKNYSSGMKSKLGFAIATTINPDILIIDEILSVGDIKFRKKSSEKLNSMMKDGATVLLVSHSISQIRKICDRCIWLQDGQIIMDGETNEVCNAYVSSANGTNIKKRRK